MMTTPFLTPGTPQNTTTGMHVPGVVPEEQSSGIDLEVVKWSLICVFSTLLAFAAATYQYYKKRSELPKAKKARRKREGKKRKAVEESRIAELSQDPTPSSNFLDVFRKKQKSGVIFIEFKGIQKLQSAKPATEAFDHSRVKLDEVPGRLGSDYINASWIDAFISAPSPNRRPHFVEGYSKPKAYIAAQGPTRHTVGDFWRMIWQVDCHCIVMATNLFEHARQQCEKYWHNSHGRYGDIDVWLEKSDFTADFITRSFRIEKAGCSEPRIVRQFQIAGWSDHDCPNIASVLEYRRVIKTYKLNKPGPLVVHCSKGSGRTGTFIAVDSLLEEYLAEDTVNVYKFVNEMRKQRFGMVGTKDQYELIYRCVSTFIQCGVTVISAKELPSSVQRMSLKDPKTKTNAFEKEFKTLATIVPPLSVGECAGGHRAENRRKSRDVMLQPPERARPYLMSHENNESTDFINAVYVDGYKNMNAFIVTQWPMKNTINDIWRLLYDYSITSFVVLNDFPHSRSFPCFWPATVGERRKFGPVLVELAQESTIPGVTSRLFYIKKRRRYTNAVLELVEAGEKLASMVIHEKERNDVKVVRMFQIMCWPNTQRVPSSSAILLELLMLVEEWQAKTNPRNPICVMSKNGVSRCGQFCAIHIAYDKLRMEGEVDIFKSVRTVRQNRPQLVENLTEYIYCYTFMVILLEILDLGQVQLTDGIGQMDNVDKEEEEERRESLPVRTPIDNRGCWSTQLPRAFTKGRPNALSRRRMSRSLEFLPQMLPWLISSDFKTYAKKYKFTYINPTLTFSDESIEYETSNSMDDLEVIEEPQVSVVESDEGYDNPSFVGDILVHNPPGYRARRKSTRSLPADAELSDRNVSQEIERGTREMSVQNWEPVPHPIVRRHSLILSPNKSYPPSPDIKKHPRPQHAFSQLAFSYNRASPERKTAVDSSRSSSARSSPMRVVPVDGRVSERRGCSSARSSPARSLHEGRSTPSRLSPRRSITSVAEEQPIVTQPFGKGYTADAMAITAEDEKEYEIDNDQDVIELQDIVIHEPVEMEISREEETSLSPESSVTLTIEMAPDFNEDKPPDLSGYGRRGRRGTLVRQSCVSESEDAELQESSTDPTPQEDKPSAVQALPPRAGVHTSALLEPRRPMSMLRVNGNYGTLCKQLSKSESGYLSSPSDIETRVELYRQRSRSETDLRIEKSLRKRRHYYKQYSEECPRNHPPVDPGIIVIDDRAKPPKQDVVINIPEQNLSEQEGEKLFHSRLPLQNSAAKRHAYRRSSLKNRYFSTSSEAEDVDFHLYNRTFDELFRKTRFSVSLEGSLNRLSPFAEGREPYMFSSSSEVEDERLPHRQQIPSRTNSRKHKAKRTRVMRGSSSEMDLYDGGVASSSVSLSHPEQAMEMVEFPKPKGEQGSTDGDHSSPGKNSNNSVIHFPVTGEVNV